MDGIGRKRTPLGPVSPSSAKKDTKRRAAQGSYNRLETPSWSSDSAFTLSENIHPNVSTPNPNSGVATPKGGRQDFLTSSQQRLDKVTSSGSTNAKNGHQNFLSPSQRRLSNVDFSGLSYQSPASRLIKNPSLMTTSKIPFQLPASTLSTNKALYTNDIDPRLFDTYNQDRGKQDMRPPKYSNCRIQFDSRITETPETAQKNENSRHVIVNIPDIDDLDIPRPEWFPKNSSELTKSRETSTSGVKNLMNNFNAVGNDFEYRNANDDAMVSDDDDDDATEHTEHDDQSHHRGEYLSDDEFDPNLDMSESVQISILPSTKVYFNLEDNVVNEFRKRLNREGYVSNDTVVPTNSVSDSVHVIETVTLKELVEKTSTKYSKMNFMCNVKIKKVQTGDTWWYDCCPKCHEELNEFEGMFKCPNCKLTIPVTEKRYRIMIIAEDSTGVANVNLSDRAVKRLVGKSATNMVDELGEGVTKSSIPQLIMDVAEKDVTLNIAISDDNVLINSTLYNATDAYPSKNSKPSSSESVQKIEDNTLSSCGDNVELAICDRTPGSVKSCNKKIKLVR
ncbi:hypothetical protein POM88_046245 [Heracleum sosnowskyi]|uniref:Replication factor A C-terminal domain-containing protein n=1 Tax=Heracleum sosnowskyi TaxID=360622 RepID=A0AAD8M5R3_9APIA|nr:hypothetical protein POM88_046245 [Heracleum sosnowskyi]